MDGRRIALGCFGLALLAGCAPISGNRMPRPEISAESSTASRPALSPVALQISDPPATPKPTPAPGPIVPAVHTVPATLPVIPHLPSIPSPGAAAPKPLAPVIESQSLPPPNSTAALRELCKHALETYARMDTYVMRMRRREVVAGSTRPEELILCKFRKAPFSVYMKWVGGAGKGREVTFVKDRYEGKIHTLTAPGDIPLLSGTVISLAPDSPLVQSKSRYPITDAGLGSSLDRFNRLVTAAEKGDTREGKLEYLGPARRAEFAEPVNHVIQTVAAKADPNMLAGGARHWYFDATSHLPVLIVAYDEKQHEVEYYCHDRFEYPVRLDDDDFNPDKLFKRPK